MPHRLCLALLAATIASAAQGPVIKLDPPGPREFVVDKANVIQPADKQAIQQLCDRLLTDTVIPVVVVTIDSMSAYGAPDLRIETFANLLFDQWGIGQAKVGNSDWNRGALLLFSKGDRKVRVQLGADWPHDADATAQRIVDDTMVPRFKQGDFSGGIRAGVEALEGMIRGTKRAPTRAAVSQPAAGVATGYDSAPVSNGGGGVGVGGIGVIIAVVAGIFSRLFSGRSRYYARGYNSPFYGGSSLFGGYGGGAGMGGGGFGGDSGGGGGGFSGGSFGGGSSDGGGATGSW